MANECKLTYPYSRTGVSISPLVASNAINPATLKPIQKPWEKRTRVWATSSDPVNPAQVGLTA